MSDGLNELDEEHGSHFIHEGILNV